MHPAKTVRIVVLLVTTAYAVVLFFAHEPLSSCVSKVLSYIPMAVGYGLVLFDLWIWRFPLVHLLVGRPRLGGTWVGTIEPAKESQIPEGGDRGPIRAALVIEQTYWTISVTVMTTKSRSRSISAGIRDAEGSARRMLSYSYANEPDQSERPRSSPHYGAADLEAVGRVPTGLRGRYWTDRFTAGDMNFRFVTRKVDYATLDAVIDLARVAP